MPRDPLEEILDNLYDDVDIIDEALSSSAESFSSVKPWHYDSKNRKGCKKGSKNRKKVVDTPPESW